MTAGTERPPALRAVLKGMQADLDEASRQQGLHIAEHGCRPGHGNCRAGDYWAGQVAEAQAQLGLTRFCNEVG